MFDFLKKLFDEGPLTFDQFVEKLNTNKDIKLANLADGAYVGKDKFDAKVTELSGVKQQLDDANATIQSYKDMDIEGIKQSASDWETKYTTDTAALQQKLDEQAREFAAKTYLSGYQFTDELAKEAVYAKFMAKGFKLGEDGKFEGADAFMTELKTAYPRSFAAPAGESNPAGGNPSGGSNGGTPAGGTQGAGSGTHGKPRPWFAPQAAPKFKGQPRTLTEMMQYANEHPGATIDFE